MSGKTIAELQEENESLRRRVNTLKLRLDLLKRRFNRLKGENETTWRHNQELLRERAHLYHDKQELNAMTVRIVDYTSERLGKANKGRKTAKENAAKRKEFFKSKFLGYVRDGWEPALALEEANEDLKMECGRGYKKSRLNTLTKDPELVEHFPKLQL